MRLEYNGAPLGRDDFNAITVWMLDVDDTSYHAGTGIHDQIKENIVREANANKGLDALKTAWAEQGLIGSDKIIKPEHLGVLFPLIVNHYRAKGPVELAEYANRVYDVDYSRIPPQPEFVRAVRKLRQAGKSVVLYTNGPFGELGGYTMHASKVMRQLGFKEGEFAENQVVDLFKTDKEPGLLKSFQALLANAADVFRKPTTKGFLNACAYLGIEPDAHGKFPHVAFLDDGLKTFEPLKDLGVISVYVGVSDKPLAQEPLGHLARVKVWQDVRDSKGRVYSSAGAFLKHAASFVPTRRPGSKVATRPGPASEPSAE